MENSAGRAYLNLYKTRHVDVINGGSTSMVITCASMSKTLSSACALSGCYESSESTRQLIWHKIDNAISVNYIFQIEVKKQMFNP